MKSIRALTLSVFVALFALCAFADTETVDGIEWTYTVCDGKATVGTDGGAAAIPTSTSGAITIPSELGGYQVTSIGEGALSFCSGLTSVTIPEGVTNIGCSAFYNCSGMTSVTIPSSVTSIGTDAFNNCISLTSVTIPSSVTSISEGTFSYCYCLTSMMIPSSVTSIGVSAFSYSGLSNVTIPSSVTNIGSSAFSYCSGLMSVTIPEGVTSIGEHAFYWCSGLKSVTIPSSVTSIGGATFYCCSELQQFFVDKSNPNYSSINGLLLTKDGKTLIQGVNKNNISIPEGVANIGSSAFRGCYRLTSITIPLSVTSIKDGAFRGCSGLASVTIPSSVTSIGASAFSGCSGLTSLTIPSSVTSIGYEAFYGCSGLMSVTIPSSVTSIGSSAFFGCSGLTSVTIPSSVTSIGGCAFSDCYGLTSVTIPSSVTSIGDYAFAYCYSLETAYFDGNAPTMDDDVFYSDCASECTAYVKKGSTGWGVDIPGKWKGINIAYYTAYNVEGAGEVKIHDDWVQKYAPGKSEEEVTELLAEPAANGMYKNWECYVLGLDPTNAESKIVVSAPQSEDSGSISVSLNLNVPAGCGYTISNEVTVVGGSGGHVVTALPNGFTIDLTGDDDPSGLYTIKVKLVPDGSSASTSEIEVEQTVGVRKSTSELTKTAIAVPWGELTGKGEQSICVSNIVKTANLTVGDKLHVYNTASRAYETWQLSSNPTWEPLATYVILEDGSVSKVSAGAPTTTMIARGSAVWLERQDTSKPFYLYGEYQSGTIETSIVGGTTATPVWNFVAPPTLGDFDLNNITGASENDKIVVTTADGPKIYTYKDGAWGSDVNTTVTRTLPSGGTIDVVKKTRDTSNTTIAAGTGFMYVSQGGAPTIQW